MLALLSRLVSLWDRRAPAPELAMVPNAAGTRPNARSRVQIAVALLRRAAGRPRGRARSPALTLPLPGRPGRLRPLWDHPAGLQELAMVPIWDHDQVGIPTGRDPRRSQNRRGAPACAPWR
jgi:hypothetical protein